MSMWRLPSQARRKKTRASTNNRRTWFGWQQRQQQAVEISLKWTKGIALIDRFDKCERLGYRLQYFRPRLSPISTFPAVCMIASLSFFPPASFSRSISQCGGLATNNRWEFQTFCVTAVPLFPVHRVRQERHNLLRNAPFTRIYLHMSRLPLALLVRRSHCRVDSSQSRNVEFMAAQIVWQ